MRYTNLINIGGVVCKGARVIHYLTGCGHIGWVQDRLRMNLSGSTWTCTPEQLEASTRGNICGVCGRNYSRDQKAGASLEIESYGGAR
jgi:hypothetical protein